jgi:ABC-type Fe3+/spermidine/putrescine transport system ATPase subunit
MTSSLPLPVRGRIDLAGLSRRFAHGAGIDRLDLHIRAGEFFTLLGPSGCGKTTTLMMIAGFVEPEAGTVSVDGVDITRASPPERGLGVVFQNYALFPHLSVRENLAFPLQMRGAPQAVIDARVRDVLDLVRLNDPDRLPGELSGGQQQRVAVARAIVFDPPVLLMDEPLGALDRSLRLHLQRELRELQQRLGITVIYVTHDQDEAMSMSDRIAIVNEGRIEQIDTPRRLYDAPASGFVARFLGDNNVLCGRAGPASDTIELDHGRLLTDTRHHFARGTPLAVALRPERIRIEPHASGSSATRARVLAVTHFGSHDEIALDADGFGALRARSPNDGLRPVPQRGDTVNIGWSSSDLRVLPDGGVAPSPAA